MTDLGADWNAVDALGRQPLTLADNRETEWACLKAIDEKKTKEFELPLEAAMYPLLQVPQASKGAALK